MLCCMNGVHIIEIPKLLAETTHAIEFVDPFDTAHLLINLLQLPVV